jgi:uncharacterized protein YdaU (DUF1376 family)
MAGTDCCCQSVMSVEIAPEDEKRAVTMDLFTADGESAQAKRDEELAAMRQQKIKEAEEKKAAMQAARQARTNGFFSGIVKKMKSMSDNIDKLASDFLNDDDNNK